MKLVFTGIQWCGKGTQARILVEKYGFRLIEMWAEFRKIIATGSDLWMRLKEIMDAGHQVGGDLGKEIMEKVLHEAQEENIVFDAFIRNERNKEIFDRLLPDYKVVFFNLSKEKSMQRLLGRMYDPQSQETFPSGVTHNPKTGRELIKRQDDNEQSILNRIHAFVDLTLPIVEIQKKEWRVIEINADQSVENVGKEVQEKIKM